MIPADIPAWLLIEPTRENIANALQAIRADWQLAGSISQATYDAACLRLRAAMVQLEMAANQ